MKKTFPPSLVAGILLIVSLVGVAQPQESFSAELKPLLTISLSGYDAISSDLRSIAEASENPQLILSLLLLGNQGPPGLDTTKPWGVVVQTDGREFPTYAFVPVTDLEQLLNLAEAKAKALAPDAGQLVPEPDENGVYQFDVQDRAIYLQQKKGWVFISDSRQILATAPADPVPLLEGLNESYAVAFRLTVANLPPGEREGILGWVESQLTQRRQPTPGEGAWERAVGKLITPQSMEDFTKWLDETAAVQVGLAVDPRSKSLRIEGEITAIEGTSTAREYALLGKSTSDLAGFFLPEDAAALTALVAGTISERYRARLKDTIDSYRSDAIEDLDRQDLPDADRQLAKQVLGDLIDVVNKTVEGRRFEAAVAVLAGADSLNFVAGGFVADTAKLERLFKQVVNLTIKDDPGVAEVVTLDAQTYQGVRMHTLSVAADRIPDGKLPATIVGDSLRAVVGFSDENAYLAVGPQSMETLKKAIDQSQAAAGESAAPFRLSISAVGIGRLIEGMGGVEESELPPEIIDALTQAGPNGHITLVSEAVPNGVRTRFEIEAGVLKVIGAAVGELMKQFGPGAGGFPGPGGLPGQPNL